MMINRNVKSNTNQITGMTEASIETIMTLLEKLVASNQVPVVSPGVVTFPSGNPGHARGFYDNSTIDACGRLAPAIGAIRRWRSSSHRMVVSFIVLEQR